MLKPILFNREMVRAILCGNKHKTRRVIKPQPAIRGTESGIFELMDDGSFQMKIDGYSGIYDYPVYPKYNPGDVLWVRECWGAYSYDNPDSKAMYYLYRADYPDSANGYWFESEKTHFCDFPLWRPSIHMPRDAARIFLIVTDVSVERLQDIDKRWINYDAEGIRNPQTENIGIWMQEKFISLWDSTIKPSERDKYGWDANPYVFVYAFEKCEEPVSKAG